MAEDEFPTLIQSIDGNGHGRRTTGVSEGPSVDGTIRDILGWRARDDDPKAFVAALTRAFSFVEVEGHREWRHSPQTLTVQADLGAVTGAQASIYARTKAIVEQALPIVDRLEPLGVAPDKELTEASRAIVRGRLEQLPVELGLDGGPRVARVDDIFRILIGFDAAKPPTGDVPVRGELRRLQERFGFNLSRVNTVEEEASFTDFQVLADYVASLATSWVRVRDTFNRAATGRDRFLGTQLVVLSRSLAIAAETVEEARLALRSVFIGDAEAELIDVRDAARSSLDPPLSLAEGLRWIEDLATVEGPNLVSEAGKEGVVTLEPTFRRLATFAETAAAHADVGGRHPRVKRAFNDLAHALHRAADATTGITPERHTITNLTPDVKGDRLTKVKITGTNLRLPADVILRSGRKTWGADSVTAKTDGKSMEAIFSPSVPVTTRQTYAVSVEIDGEVEQFDLKVPTAVKP